MDNLINVYMNYKINRLVKYAKVICNDVTAFGEKILTGYFKTYVDNYYYGVFSTLETFNYTDENLLLEFDGIMHEMLDDYSAYELQESNEDYATNTKKIRNYKDICLEIVELDKLEITDNDDINDLVIKLVDNNSVIKELIKDRTSRLITLVKETYNNSSKILELNDNYFVIKELKFVNHDEIKYLKLKQDIRILDNYKKSMINRVYNDDKFDLKKLECLIQKVSLYILKNILEHKEIGKMVIDLSDKVINRGKFNPKILKLIDNPLFRKYVVLGVDFNNYTSHKNICMDEYTYACIQDFSHINDVYVKTENIYKEDIFNYIIVSDLKERDRDFFVKYQNEGMKILLIEEEEDE